ncbi:MAG: hypothetical protein U9R31_01925 [Candidatus Omnitrophota bacterium]|nr:hypothetical protein [Candidatus Omnitrophota bacterium]
MKFKPARTTLFRVGEVNSLWEEIGKDTIGLARGNRDGMSGKIIKGTWETLDIGYVKGVREVRSSANSLDANSR